MRKRLLALLLCSVIILSIFAGCSTANTGDDYKGQVITTYLTANLYDLDPVHAFYNESAASIVGLMFDTLFTLDANGKVQKSLAKSYTISEDEVANEYKMSIRLKDAKWSDGTYVSANDVVFAWQRLLELDSAQEAAALLYDVKNARDAKEGNASIDDVRICAEDELLLTIEFEGKIDYDQFLLNLTSIALAPLRENVVESSEDWAKKSGTMVCSGPFKLGRVNMTESGDYPNSGEETTFYDPAYVKIENSTSTNPAKEQKISDFVLERNTYYYRNPETDSIMKSVLPHRICVDCSLTDEQLDAAYKAGMILYVGDVPLSLRKDSAIAEDVKVAKKSLSTNTVYLNENALIDNGTEEGYALFANVKVRQALSMAVDREAIAEAVVYAKAATGLIPDGVWETGKSSRRYFRKACTTEYEYLKTNMSAAAALLSEAGIDPTQYSFSISYAAYDDVHAAIANMIAESWCKLGFNVEATPIGTIPNNDWYEPTLNVPEDVCDDLYAEALRAERYEAIILDSCAISVDPFSYLAPFAKAFSGQGVLQEDGNDDYPLLTHTTGYDSEEYNALMETIFAEKTIAKRADNLRLAEEILMTDMPAIPVVFNYKGTATSRALGGVGSTYYVAATFKDAQLSSSSYSKYLAAGEKFVTDNFDDLLFHRSKTCSFRKESGQTKWDIFVASTTIYSHFVSDK